MPAGDLRYRIGFYQRGSGAMSPPDYGSQPGYPSIATFIVRANIDAKAGSEQVLAARLTGKNFVTITVRQSSTTDQVDTDWMAKDENSGEIYNIRSVIDPQKGNSNHGFWWEMVCEKGVAV